MAKPEKIDTNNFNIAVNEIANNYVNVFINNFVSKFRNFNKDGFQISIFGLDNFINRDDKVLIYLFEQLNKNNFKIEFTGEEERTKNLEIACRNITNDLTYNFIYQIQNLPSIVEISSRTDIPLVGIFIMKIVAQVICNYKILYKAMVLDLDDTLWNGTLSEISIEKLKDNLNSEEGNQFIEFMKFVSTLVNELGLFIAICSRNELSIVESTINKLEENIFPLKNKIDYIVANYNDKSENIKMIAEQFNILPSSIVFIDDNQIVRDEVKSNLSEVFVPEWSSHFELVTQLNTSCVFERFELSLNSQNRRKQYKIIQTERTNNSLPTLSVQAIIDNKNSESLNLYAKSNQFKFASKDDNFEVNAESLYFEIRRENGENLGICSAITYTLSKDTLYIHNWAISCRYYGIGLEEIILLYIHKLSNGNKIIINYLQSEYNLKVKEFLNKYLEIFMIDEKNSTIEIVFTNESIENFNKNTNLRIILNGQK